MFSCYFLVTEFGLLKNETHVANYFTFKVKELIINSILGLYCHAILTQ